MYKLILILSLGAAGVIGVLAQDYNKGEFYGGFSVANIDNSHGPFGLLGSAGDTGARNFYGFEAAGVYNFSRYVGIKGDVSGNYKSSDFSLFVPPNDTFNGHSKNSLYNYLVGVQFKDNSPDKTFKPFARNDRRGTQPVGHNRDMYTVNRLRQSLSRPGLQRRQRPRRRSGRRPGY